MNRASQTVNGSETATVRGSHPLLTMILLVGVLGAIIAGGSMVSHGKKGQASAATEQPASLLERVLGGTQ